MFGVKRYRSSRRVMSWSRGGEMKYSIVGLKTTEERDR